MGERPQCVGDIRWQRRQSGDEDLTIYDTLACTVELREEFLQPEREVG